MRWLRLGLRLSLGSGRAGLGRMALMATGATIGSLVVLASLAAAAVYGAQSDRSLAREPRHAEPDGHGLVFARADDHIGDRALTRVAVARASADSPLAPGLSRYPGQGEAIISPGLAELLRTDPRASSRFPERVVGLIGEQGLVAPDELYAFVGVAADDSSIVDYPVVVGIGHPPAGWRMGGPSAGDAFTTERVLAIAFALVVLVPYGTFLATCARLSASTRDRRIAALRLRGVSARQAAVVNAVEAGAAATAGSLLGYAAFRGLAPLSQSWHLGPLHWYAEDVALPPAAAALVLTVTVAFSVMVGVFAARPARLAPLRIRRDAPARRPSLLRLAPLAAGLTLAVLAAHSGPDRVRTYLELGTAAAFVGLGLPLVVPLLTWHAATVVPRRAPVALRLAAARLRHAPGVAPRLVAALTTGVFVTGATALGATLVVPAVRDATGDLPSYATYTTDLRDPAFDEAVHGLGGLIATMSNRSARIEGEDRFVSVTDCESLLAQYTLPAGESCVDGEAYRVAGTNDVYAMPPAGTPIALDGLGLTAPTQVLHPALRYEYWGGGMSSVLVTTASPLLVGHDPPGPTWRDVWLPDALAGERLAEVVSARWPAARLWGSDMYPDGTDDVLAATLLAAALTIAVGGCLAAFAVAAIDRSIEGRRESAGLTVVGARARTLAASEVAAAAVPLTLGLGLAMAAVVGIGRALAAVLDVPVTGTARPAVLLGLGALGVGLVLVTAPALVRRRVTATTLRRP